MSCSEREWRNRQTRTFEGRVFSTYGFKSRLSHQNWSLENRWQITVFGISFFVYRIIFRLGITFWVLFAYFTQQIGNNVDGFYICLLYCVCVQIYTFKSLSFKFNFDIIKNEHRAYFFFVVWATTILEYTMLFSIFVFSSISQKSVKRVKSIFKPFR